MPSSNDQLCIHVSGETFPAAIVNASVEVLAINMMKGPTLFLEPVPVGHPAHGERSAPGVPTSVWKVTRVSYPGQPYGGRLIGPEPNEATD